MITTSRKIESARTYAIEMHTSTNHTYDGKPYEVHLQLAYDFGCRFAHLLPDDETRETVLAAIWTHDVIEDCRQTYNDVKGVLGEAVAELVYAVTNEKGKTRKERANDHYYLGIRKTPYATFVKCCDRLANMQYSAENDTRMLEMYAKENAAFSEKLFEPVYSEMFQALRDLISAGRG